MKANRLIKRLRAAACLCLAAWILCGCASILDRQYATVEPHSKKYWESGTDDTLRAENHQDLVNDLLLLIGRHTEDATIRYYDQEGASVADIMEQAANEVQQDTPLGAWAVEYITSSTQSQRSYEEIVVHISYRRSQEQIQALVNATTTEALPDLLKAALDQGKTELAVRIGYWEEGSAEQVEEIVAQIRAERGIGDDQPWTISYYPPGGTTGLIEFVMGEQPQQPGENPEG
jgi:hypothetical protein